jgi:hypothetical protein
MSINVVVSAAIALAGESDGEFCSSTQRGECVGRALGPDATNHPPWITEGLLFLFMPFSLLPFPRPIPLLHFSLSLSLSLSLSRRALSFIALWSPPHHP